MLRVKIFCGTQRGSLGWQPGATLLRRTASSATSTDAVFDKILIANRGEIACRVMRTAKRMGIKTVAVYSDADAGSQHVAMADEAFRIGPPPSKESYLRADVILDVARRSGAQAIHPGYGFLSENESFSRACKEHGIEFVGPPEQAMRDMGSKSASKLIMTAAGVPVTPGYWGEDQSPDTLLREAEAIRYPIMVKAVMGGGGKGMRIVRSSEELISSAEACQREAAASFGDSRVLLERYLPTSRHVELQVFADKHGRAVYLYERDCSVQRRHQKVLEESPAPRLSEETRAAMGDSAVAAALAVGYVGAGTVEFMLNPSDGTYYFMEMNTRLQVEHPVTEMVLSGLDLVEWQLRVAAGQPLPLDQAGVKARRKGHAIEARVYAENPSNNFLPATGVLKYLSQPAQGPNVRVDTGVRQGDAVSIYYDPMISKLIVWGETRADALRHMSYALRDYGVVGLPNNLSFLRGVVAHPAFAEGGVDTSFLGKHLPECLPPHGPAHPHVIALAALATALRRAGDSGPPSAGVSDPWAVRDGSRPGAPGAGDHQATTLQVQDAFSGTGPAGASAAISPLPLTTVTVKRAGPQGQRGGGGGLGEFSVTLTLAPAPAAAGASLSNPTPSAPVASSPSSSAAPLALAATRVSLRPLDAETPLRSQLPGFESATTGRAVPWVSIGALSASLDGIAYKAVVVAVHDPATGDEEVTVLPQGSVSPSDAAAAAAMQAAGAEGAFARLGTGAVTLRLPARRFGGAAAASSSAPASIVTPMPGKVVKLLVSAGQTVAPGEALMYLEAMKMEHVIRAPSGGSGGMVIEKLSVAVGDQVEDGRVLATFAAAPTPTAGAAAAAVAK